MIQELAISLWIKNPKALV